MSGSLNEVQLIGHLCADVEQRSMQSGKPVCNLRIATNESWKDRESGERKERVEYHRVVIFNEGLCKIAASYLKKGSHVFIRGQLQTRSWEQDGQTKYSTEICLQGFNSNLTMLDSAGGKDNGGGYGGGNQGGGFGGTQGGGFGGGPSGGGGFNDDIPFSPITLI